MARSPPEVLCPTEPRSRPVSRSKLQIPVFSQRGDSRVVHAGGSPHLLSLLARFSPRGDSRSGGLGLVSKHSSLASEQPMGLLPNVMPGPTLRLCTRSRGLRMHTHSAHCHSHRTCGESELVLLVSALIAISKPRSDILYEIHQGGSWGRHSSRSWKVLQRWGLSFPSCYLVTMMNNTSRSGAEPF